MLLLWVHFKNYFAHITLALCLLIGGEAMSQSHLKRACIQSNNTDVLLSWDLAQDPCGSFIEIEIYARPNNFTPFTSIGKVTNPAQTNFVHTGAAAVTSNWSYHIVYRFLCNGLESSGDTLNIDLAQPNTSEFDSVSYDPVTKGLFLAWAANNAPDISGYYLWDFENNNNFKFDSVYNELNHLDTRKDPNSKQIFFSLTAFDSCANQSVISSPHAAPYLSGTATSCGSILSINWQPYIGHSTVVSQVYVSLDGADYTIDTMLQGTETSWKLEIKSGQTAEIFIRSKLSNGYTSRSNPVSFTALDSFKLKANYISSIDWIGTNTFEMEGIVDQAVNFDSLYIYQLREAAPLYLWREDLSQLPYPLTINIKSDTVLSYYRQTMVDRCGRYYYSNIGHNMVLKGNPNAQVDVYDLYWTETDYLAGNIQEYQISIGDDISKYSTWNIKEQGINDTFTSETVTDQNLNIRCFQAIALEEDPNPFNYAATIHSNPVCFIQEPNIYFPNAIAVRGINTTFYPVGLSIDKQKSTLQIFALNGQRVYLNTLEHPWNGYAPDGSAYQTTVFVYIADVFFLNGERQKYSGNITVLY